jgi:hypothetical protein
MYFIRFPARKINDNFQKWRGKRQKRGRTIESNLFDVECVWFNTSHLGNTWIFVINYSFVFIILVLLPADREREDVRFFRKVQSGPGMWWRLVSMSSARRGRYAHEKRLVILHFGIWCRCELLSLSFFIYDVRALGNFSFSSSAWHSI